jgi:uncharacterized membrane protein YhhN
MEIKIMTILLLSLSAFFFAFLCIRAKYVNSPFQLYLFKPLATVVIIVIALTAGWSSETCYWYFILAGLLLSLSGDIFLMLPNDKFIEGLLSFLLAHLLFITAFISSAGIGLTLWLIIILCSLAIILSSVLLPYAGKIKIPVLLYILVILMMAWQAWERWIKLNETGALLAGIGASLFLLSDWTLAYDKFKKAIKNADFIILSTYYLAIWFIALSV